MEELKISELKKKLPPEKYKKLLPLVSLDEISLIELSCHVDRVKLYEIKDSNIRINDSYKVCLDNQDGIDRIHASIVLEVPVRGKGKNPLMIQAVYSARFIHTNELPPEFWEIYKEVTFPIQIWPYFREAVQSITAKMNIKPLTLPIFIRG